MRCRTNGKRGFDGRAEEAPPRNWGQRGEIFVELLGTFIALSWDLVLVATTPLIHTTISPPSGMPPTSEKTNCVSSASNISPGYGIDTSKWLDDAVIVASATRMERYLPANVMISLPFSPLWVAVAVL
jgi:hypothetical protein